MISVVIPHYKGKEKLYANLTHNLPFFDNCEIIVVNDYPDVPLTSEMKKLFPQIKVIENEKNLGFAGAVRKGISQTKNKHVLLLNNDVLLNDDSFKKALEYFKKDDAIFAVSYRQTEKDGSYVGRNKIYWSKGFFYHSKADATKDGINGWAEGGSMLFDKQKYHIINGFDELYSPFYWEDVDLSYRAWKAGYTILFDIHTTVEHHHESTIATYFQASRVKTIAYRNQFITIWKNISDGKMIATHILYVFKNYMTALLKGNAPFIKGFWMAFLLLPKILSKRKDQKKTWKISDQKIFNKFI